LPIDENYSNFHQSLLQSQPETQHKPEIPESEQNLTDFSIIIIDALIANMFGEKYYKIETDSKANEGRKIL
jgi:hypothetical protein